MTPPVIFQLGNQHSLHGTEAAYRDGYTAAGCVVLGVTQDECLQRGQTWLYDRVTEAGAAMLVYSRTHNGTALTPDWTALWRRLEGEGVQTVGAHLDVFWGIPEREDWIRSGDAQFTVGTLFTADGGSDEKWAAAGVNHRWLPPGCDTRFIPKHAGPIAELAGKIVFVGSAYGYHPLWSHRAEMIDFCSRTWPDRFVIYGGGSPNGAVRGENLARIYASDCIVVGDCCFADQRRAYVSDRCPESLGRRSTLLMATNDGLEERWQSGTHYIRWAAGDFDMLAHAVKTMDDDPAWRALLKGAGENRVWNQDTYRHRAKQILETVGVEVPSGDD